MNVTGVFETWKIRVVNEKIICKYQGLGTGILVRFLSTSGEVYYIQPRDIFATLSIAEAE